MAPKIDKNVCSNFAAQEERKLCEKEVKRQCDDQVQVLCGDANPKDKKAQKKCMADLNDGKVLANQTKMFAVDIGGMMIATPSLPECRHWLVEILKKAPPSPSRPAADPLAGAFKGERRTPPASKPKPTKPAADPLAGAMVPALVPLTPKKGEPDKKAEKKNEKPSEDVIVAGRPEIKSEKPEKASSVPAKTPDIPADRSDEMRTSARAKADAEAKAKADADAKAKADAEARAKADAEESAKRVAMIEKAARKVTRPTVELKKAPRTIDDFDKNSQMQMNALVTNDINDDVVRGRINSLLASYPDLAVIDWQDPKGRALARRLGVPELLPGERYHRWRVMPSLMSVRDDTQDDDRQIMNMLPLELISLRNRTKDGQGMMFAGSTTVMIDNEKAEYDNFEKVFHSGVKEAVVVVGDPLHEEAGTLFEQLIEESGARNDKISYVWIPHTEMFDASATLARLGIKRKKDGGRPAVFRVKRDGDTWKAASHRPAGFKIMKGDKDYVNTTDAPVLLVIGAPDGTTGDSQTRELAKALITESLTGRVEFQLSVSYDNGTSGVVQRKATELVYISADDMPRIFKESFENPVSSEKNFVNMFRTNPDRPQAYYFTGAKGKRQFFPVDVKELPGNVEPAKTRIAETPQAGEAALTGGDSVIASTGIGIEKQEAKAESTIDWKKHVKHITKMSELKKLFERLEDTTDTEGLIVYGNLKEDGNVGKWLEEIAAARENGKIKKRIWFVDTSDIEQGNMMTFMAGEKQKNGNPVIVMKDGSKFKAPSILLCTRPKRGMTWTCEPYNLP